MKQISFEKMEMVQGGAWDNETACGFAVGGMILFSGGWAIFAAAAALTFCLSGDSQQ